MSHLYSHVAGMTYNENNGQILEYCVYWDAEELLGNQSFNQ